MQLMQVLFIRVLSEANEEEETVCLKKSHLFPVISLTQLLTSADFNILRFPALHLLLFCLLLLYQMELRNFIWNGRYSCLRINNHVVSYVPDFQTKPADSQPTRRVLICRFKNGGVVRWKFFYLFYNGPFLLSLHLPCLLLLGSLLLFGLHLIGIFLPFPPSHSVTSFLLASFSLTVCSFQMAAFLLGHHLHGLLLLVLLTLWPPSRFFFGFFLPGRLLYGSFSLAAESRQAEY